ncbi:fimbrial protein [Paraburkholderia sp. J63]|uniref:fimbrial protein n=1 Tax=Paraburkholderia sp. J63 TaxID=2805434 RepID=UPI002ABD4071|nr:fimbrial protein [Paraburkholderia sp. J63]
MQNAASFTIDLNDCPAGLGQYGLAIQYEIDANTTILDSTNAVVALDGTSSATGVGIQLLDGNGNPFPLGQVVALNGYNPATGGSHTVPLRARYYQTATTK